MKCWLDGERQAYWKDIEHIMCITVLDYSDVFYMKSYDGFYHWCDFHVAIQLVWKHLIQHQSVFFCYRQRYICTHTYHVT